MPAEQIVGCILKGTLAERPTHAAYLSGYLYYVNSGPNLGDLYWNNGTTWILIQGASKAEILQNKTFTSSQNNISGIPMDPFLSNKREGWITPGITAEASLKYALKGLPYFGNYTLVKDGTEGYVSRFDLSVNGNIGYISNASVNFVTRRSFNPRFKFRVKPGDVANQNMMLGFTTALPVVANGWAVDASYAGAIFAITPSYATYVIRHGNAETVAATHYTTAVTKVANYVTFEIIMSSSDIKFYIDNILILTATTNLPALNKDIYLTLQLQRSAAVYKDFFISKAYFRDDIV